MGFEALDWIGAEEAWDGPMQMALDEALLRLASRPVLRFFRWARPQVTFGYFGKFEEARLRFPSLLLTRRWTGGGIVEHGDDLTFSLALPGWHPATEWRGREFYRALHGCVARALGAVGKKVWLAGSGWGGRGEECFVAPVEGDVLSGLGKVAGGALRRTRAGVLYQGSVQGAGGVGFEEQLLRELGGRRILRGPTAQEVSMAAELAGRRYGTEAWLKGYESVAEGSPGN